MPVGAAVAGKPGEQEPQAVQQLRSRAEGAADTRHTGALVQRQGGGDIQRLLHTGLGGLGHAAAGIGGEGLQIPPGALGIQHPQSQGGLAGAGYARYAHDFPQGDVYINILQIVDLGPTNQHFINHCSLLHV